MRPTLTSAARRRAAWHHEPDLGTLGRAGQDYLDRLDKPAWGAATDVAPKFVAATDPAAQWTGAFRNAAFFAYADIYLIDVEHGIIVDVEASRAIRLAEVGASQTMIERTEQRFGIKPDWLVGDTTYGAADNLGWLVDEKDIAPLIDKSQRDGGTFSRDYFTYDEARDCYVCPADSDLPTNGRLRHPRSIEWDLWQRSTMRPRPAGRPEPRPPGHRRRGGRHCRRERRDSSEPS